MFDHDLWEIRIQGEGSLFINVIKFGLRDKIDEDEPRIRIWIWILLLRVSTALLNQVSKQRRKKFLDAFQDLQYQCREEKEGK